MTISPILTLSGHDEVLSLPITEEGHRGTTLTLPSHHTATSTHITTDLIASSKRPKPPPNTQLLCTSANYIAYCPNTPKTRIIKIIDKDNSISKDSCKIKGVPGNVIKMSFRNATSSEGDEVLAVVSNDGALKLSLYSIVLTDRGLKHEPIGEPWELCTNVPDGIVPVLAIQPSDTCIVAVAVGTIVYYVKLDDNNEVLTLEGVVEVPLEEIVPVIHRERFASSPIISMHIANDTNDLIAVCSKSGILLFYSTIKGELEDDEPVDLFEQEEEINWVNWMVFPDFRLEDENGIWKSIIYATNNSIRIFSLETWLTSYTIRLILPQDDQDLTTDLLYDIDDSGKFMVMTSTTSRYLYVFELITTEGYNAPDAVSRVYCYPLAKSGLFDLSVTEVEEAETVLGPYQETSQRHKIVMIGINDSTMQRYKIVTDTELVSSSEPSRAGPLTPTRAPLTPTRAQPTPLTPTRAQPAPLTPTRAQPAPLTSTITSTIPLTPTRTPLPSRTTTTTARTTPTLLPPARTTPTLLPPARTTPTLLPPARTTPTLLPPGAFTAIPTPLSTLFSTLPSRSVDQPKDVPVPVEQSVEIVDQQLMPTPLPTPAGVDTEIINPLTDYLQRIPIEGPDSDSIEVFEADILCQFQLGSISEVVEYCGGAAGVWQDINPSVVYLYMCKYLLIKETDPEVILEVYRNVPDLMQEALVVYMNQLAEVLLSAPLSERNIEAFPVLRDMMTLLYLHSLPTPEEARSSLLLSLVRNIVRSIYEVEEGEGFRDSWLEFVTENLGILVDLVKEQDYDNKSFQHTVRDVLDTVVDFLPGHILSNFPVEEKLNSSNLSLKELMKRSQEMAAPVPADLDTSGNLLPLQLIEEFDNNPHIVLSHVTSQLEKIWRVGGSDIRGLFVTVINNYYRKEWFTGLLESVLDSKQLCGQLLHEILVDKVKCWSAENKSKLRTDSTTAHPTPVCEGPHHYSSGLSPLQFYVTPLHDTPLLSLISNTLSALLPDPTSHNVGSLSRDVATAVATNQNAGFTPRDGDLVACFQGYRTWSRGRVTAVHDADDIRVTLLDSGAMVTTNSECLRRLPLFRGTPPKAKLVRLAGIDCPSEDKGETMRTFKDTVKDQELYLVPTRDNHVSVFLTNGENLKSALERSSVVMVTGDIESPPSSLLPRSQCHPDRLTTKMWDYGASSAAKLSVVVQTILCCGKELSKECPEVRDIVKFKVGAVLGSLDQYSTESGDSSSRSSIAPISSPDYPSDPEPAPAFPPDPKHRTPEPHNTPRDTHKTSHEPQHTMTIRSHKSELPSKTTARYDDKIKPDSSTSATSSSASIGSGSKVTDVIPTFAALDVREQEGFSNYKMEVTYDQNALADINKKLSLLSKTVADLDQRCKENNRKLRDISHQGDPSLQIDANVSECVGAMFQIGLGHFLGKIKEFYRDEMERKLEHHLMAITKKQDDLKLYASEEKLRDKVREHALVVAQDVKQKARHTLSMAQNQMKQRLRDDLRRDVRDRILPSWGQCLDHIHQSFTTVLENEAYKYSNTARQGRQAEQDLITKLELIERLLQRQHQSLLGTQRTLSANLNTLSSEVERLYERHDVRS